MPRRLNIAAPDGVIDAHLFTPVVAQGTRQGTGQGTGQAAGQGTTRGPYPAVILFTDIGGIRPAYMPKAQRVADAGYAVLMPNIYYRSGQAPAVPEGQHYRDMMPTLRGYAEILLPDALARDFAALMAAVDREPEFASGPIGAVGYCLTGGFPARLSSLHPGRVAAAAGFHSAGLAASGNPRAILDLIPDVKARVYFGHADRDEHLPADEIAAIDGALARAGVHFATELYAGALHGFTNADSQAYDTAADALHFKRLATLFAETLRG